MGRVPPPGHHSRGVDSGSKRVWGWEGGNTLGCGLSYSFAFPVIFSPVICNKILKQGAVLPKIVNPKGSFQRQVEMGRVYKKRTPLTTQQSPVTTYQDSTPPTISRVLPRSTWRWIIWRIISGRSPGNNQQSQEILYIPTGDICQGEHASFFTIVLGVRLHT